MNAVIAPAADSVSLQNIFDLRARNIHDAVIALAANPDTLAEALVAYNAPAINFNTMVEATKIIFGLPAIQPDLIDTLIECNAAIGRYTFSFPQWRFLTQNFNGASLVERFGMTRLTRPNDVRDDTLPKSDPQRDHFGTGFAAQTGKLHVEYRRAYILCSDGNSTLVIRNSSPYFGRDRLAHPAYVSFEKLSPERLRDITDADFASGGIFTPWQNSITADTTQNLAQALRVQQLVRALDEFDTHMQSWLFNGGAAHMADFMDFALARNAAAGKTDAPFYLCLVDNAMPPWFPITNTEASAALAQSIRAGEKKHLAGAQRKPVLLSSRFGDWPSVPKNQ